MVYLTDREPLNIVGVKDAKIKILNCSIWYLYEVGHVPELKENSIYVKSVTIIINIIRLLPRAMLRVRPSFLNTKPKTRWPKKYISKKRGLKNI